MLLRHGFSAAELASLCLGLQMMRAAYLSRATQLKNLRPGPLLSPVPFFPHSPGQLPIPFWDTMTLSFDNWGFSLLFFSFRCYWTFFLTPPPSSSFFHSLSLCLFLRSLISAQRQVGRFSRTLNESLWNCSCLFDLRFSLLKSGPRYQQRDVTSARARSNAARSECSLACAHQPKSY